MKKMRSCIFLLAALVFLFAIASARSIRQYHQQEAVERLRGNGNGYGHGNGNDDDDDEHGSGSGEERCRYDSDCTEDGNPCTVASCCPSKRCKQQRISEHCDESAWFVQPILECVEVLSSTELFARFGYRNNFWTDVQIDDDQNNYFSPQPRIRNQVMTFSPGRRHDAFQVRFPRDTTLVWTLRSPDGSVRTATASEDSLLCNVPEECQEDEHCFDEQRLCEVAQCVSGVCQFAAKDCSDHDACTVNERCDEQTGACIYDWFSCDDQNRCTRDTCEDVHYEAVCLHEQLEQCSNEDEEDCPHEVEIIVNDCSLLEVEVYDGGVYELCQTSSYLGNRSAVVLDFSAYEECALNERGTCSNRHAVHEHPSTTCVQAALADPQDPQCSLSSNHAFWMPGLSARMVFAQSPRATFEHDDQTGVGHLQGLLYSVADPTIRLRVNMWMSGLSQQPPAPNSPKRELPSACYDQVNLQDWYYYTELAGTLQAEVGSAYAGMHITVQGYGPAVQVGLGASNKNLKLGLSGWFTWVVSNPPTDSQLPTPVQSNQHGDVNIELEPDCEEDLDYCELFGDGAAQAEANQWIETLGTVSVDGAQNITYCRNFTLEQLLSCRQFDQPSTRLFSYERDSSTDVITYTGFLHSTTVLDEHCSYHGNSVCGEEVVFDTHYELSITLDAQGTRSISFLASDIEFQARWLRNVWTHSGDIRVVIETRIRHQDATALQPYTTILVQGQLLSDHETGYPLHMVQSEVPCRQEGDYCYQEWELESEDARQNQIDDFSGVKPLQFIVQVNGEQRVPVRVRINLHAKHVGSQVHLDSQIDAALQLYTDRYLHYPYECEYGRSFVDCDTVYAVLTLLYHEHLQVRIRDVYLCFPEAGSTHELLPYDAQHPQTTGCSTPGAVRLLVYSEDPSEVVDRPEVHKFLLIADPPTGIYRQGFQLEAHAFTAHKQLLQVHWYAEEEDGQGGLIEGIADYSIEGRRPGYGSDDDDDLFHYYGQHHANMAVDCEHSWEVYSWNAGRCVAAAHPYNVGFYLVVLFTLFIFAIVVFVMRDACCCCVVPVSMRRPRRRRRVPHHHHHKTTTNVVTTHNINNNTTAVNVQHRRGNSSPLVMSA